MDMIPFKLYPVLHVDALYTIFILPLSKGFRFPGETHPIWEFNYVIDGEMNFTSDDLAYYCTEGEAVLHRPDAFHTSWLDRDITSHTLTVSFTGSGLHNIPAGKFTLTDEEREIINLFLSEVPRQFNYYDKQDYVPLDTAAHGENEGYQMLAGYLELLLLSLLRRRTEARQPMCDEQSRLYAEIAGYMQDHVDDNLCLDDISRHFCISSSSLKLLFRRFVGEGAMKYYNHLRIKRGISLISGGFSVTDTAKQMNFSSQNYFSAFFKRETGNSPSKYRNK